jgi:hypothetical protein
MAIDGLDPRAHPFEGLDDAAHRPVRKGRVPDKPARKRVACYDTGH